MKKASGCLCVIIILVCVVVCAILVGNILRPGNEEEPEEQNQMSSGGINIENKPSADGVNEIVISVTQDKLRELIQKALDEKFPMQLASLLLHENGMVDVTGTMERDSFVSFVKEHNTGLGRAQLFLLQFAPEKLDFTAQFEASYHQSSGKMELEPAAFTVKDISIPVSVLPDALKEKFAVSLNDFAAKLGYTVKSVAIYEGYVTLYIE